MEDWREGSQNLEFLMQRFFQSQDFNSSTDVTFQLQDESEVKAHKIILGVSSQVFYSQFFGPMADKSVETVIVPDDIDTDAFRRMIKSIYNSGNIPNLEINEYLDLLKAANFYLLQEVIDECNEKLCDHVESLEIQDLIDWTHMMSQQSIHDQVYESCREAILAKLSSIIKENKWECINSDVRNKLLKDLEYTDVWQWDMYQIDTGNDHRDYVYQIETMNEWNPPYMYLILQVLKRLCSLEMDHIFPDRVIKFNSNMDSYFESIEVYQTFLLQRFRRCIRLNDPDKKNIGFDEKLKNHLKSIESHDKVISDTYFLLKGDGMDLDLEFRQWKPLYFSYEKLEEGGIEWDEQEETDREHFWRLLTFSKLHQLDNLTDHCYLRLYSLMLHSFPKNLAFHINRASATPGAEELFKLGIHVFVDATASWKWLKEPYFDTNHRLADQKKDEIITRNNVEGWKSFSEKVINSISDHFKLLKDTLDPQTRRAICGWFKTWCLTSSSSIEEADKKLEFYFGPEDENVANNNGD